MPKRLSDIEIAARIVPTALRWPGHEKAKTLAWDRSRECVDALRCLLQMVDHHCAEAEQNIDLSPQGINRQRAVLAKQVLSELDSFEPFQQAEKAILENIKFLEQRMTDLPKPPADVVEVALAQEIRQYGRPSRRRQTRTGRYSPTVWAKRDLHSSYGEGD
jgi:hypothetical protein